MVKSLTRIQRLEKDNLRLQKLCVDSLYLVKTFFNLVNSEEKKIIFYHGSDVHEFLVSFGRLGYRLSCELDRVLK